MKGMLKGVAAFALIASFAVSTAHAQTPVSFGIGGGLLMPLGDFSDAAKLGFQGTALVEFQPATLPIGFRVDGMYSRNSPSDDVEAVLGDVGTQIIHGTADVVYEFETAPTSTFHPYLIGGIGLYNSKAVGDDVPDGVESQTDFGLNAGAGFNFDAGNLGLFVEGRFHNIMADESVNMIPITVGVRFGGA